MPVSAASPFRLVCGRALPLTFVIEGDQHVPEECMYPASPLSIAHGPVATAGIMKTVRTMLR